MQKMHWIKFNNYSWFLKNLKKLKYNLFIKLLVSSVEQMIQLYIYFRLISIIGYYKIYNKPLLFIYFMYNSLYLLIPHS